MFLLLLSTSAWLCLQQSRNLGLAFYPSPVHVDVISESPCCGGVGVGVRDLPGGHGGVLHVGVGARQAQREVAREARETVEALVLK